MKWRPASDDSGHDYCIPVHLSDEFEEWVEQAEGNEEITVRDFTGFMIGAVQVRSNSRTLFIGARVGKRNLRRRK